MALIAAANMLPNRMYYKLGAADLAITSYEKLEWNNNINPYLPPRLYFLFKLHNNQGNQQHHSIRNGCM